MTKLKVRSNGLLLLLFAGVLWSCSESYPSIAEPIEKRSDEVVAAERESGLIPIMPTLDAPDFHFTTRGTGAFNAWEEDQVHWTTANFHVFAYQTTNNYGGSLDMNRKDDSQTGRGGAMSESPCLLYDKIMRVVDPAQQRMHFVDGIDGTNEMVYYYRMNHQNLRYNFFTFYADDAARGSLNHSASEISQNIEIDGSQDIMHSFAYHTKDQYDDVVNELIKTIPNNQLYALTADGYNQLVYSTATAHHAIQPQFNIRHLLSKFNIYVIGVESNTVNASSDFRDLLITDVKIHSKYKGQLVVAKDAWSHNTSVKDDYRKYGLGSFYEEEVENNQLIRWDAIGKDLDSKVKQRTALKETSPKVNAEIERINKLLDDTGYDAFLNDIDQHKGQTLNEGNKKFDCNNDGVIDEEDKDFVTRAFPKGKPWLDYYCNVTSSSNAVQLTEAPIMLPAGETSFDISITGLSMNRKHVTTNIQDDILDEKTPFLPFGIDGKITLPNGDQFKPGYEYTLTIYVYGYQQVGLKVAFGQPWKTGNSIEINKDGSDEGN